jgi:hypothetical protein
MTEQDGPALDGATEATREQQLDGIVAQVASDVRHHGIDDAGGLLRQRITECGIDVGDDEFALLLARAEAA